MRELIAELRQSCRSLLKTPSFSIFVIGALVLGIGANTTIFSLVDSLLLKPLQFRDASRLVEIWENAPLLGFAENTPSPGNFFEWKRRNHVFSDMAALTGDIFALTGDGPPQQLEGSHVSHNLFAMLGVQPALGRGFLPGEDRKGGPSVVINQRITVAATLWIGPIYSRAYNPAERRTLSGGRGNARGLFVPGTLEPLDTTGVTRFAAAGLR
jgi:putative ABC transport system permease protein